MTINRESVTDKIKQLPENLIGLCPQREKRLLEDLAKINQGLESGLIYNVEFNELKDSIKNTFDSAFSALKWSLKSIAEQFDYDPYILTSGERDEDYSNLIYTDMTRPTMALKNYNKYPSLNSHIFAKVFYKYLLEASTIESKLNELKPLIIKGRRPKTVNGKIVESHLFSPRPASPELERYLREEINSNFKGYHKELVDKISNNVMKDYFKARERYEDKQSTTEDKKLFAKRIKYSTFWELISEEEAIELSEKLASREASDLIEGFVYKNVEKISPVLEALGAKVSDIALIEEDQVEVEFGRIKGLIEVSLLNGDSFSVYTQAVRVYEARVPFMRYPTVFKRANLRGVVYNNASMEDIITDLTKKK